MSRVAEIMEEFKVLDGQEKLLKSRKDSLKLELDGLFQLGECERKVQGSGMSASLTKTTTWQHSQNARDDIQKIKNFDIENGDAIQRVTESWTLRTVKEKPSDEQE